MKVLLDTHSAIWLVMDDTGLGKRSRKLIQTTLPESDLLISAISFWEIALLIDRGRLRSSLSASHLRERMLLSGIAEVPLTGDIALLATQLNLHNDPADRFIAASAIASAATLVTADSRLLDWKHALRRQDARH